MRLARGLLRDSDYAIVPRRRQCVELRPDGKRVGISASGGDRACRCHQGKAPLAARLRHSRSRPASPRRSHPAVFSPRRCLNGARILACAPANGRGGGALVVATGAGGQDPALDRPGRRRASQARSRPRGVGSRSECPDLGVSVSPRSPMSERSL
jgi:hypothetical protein